MQRDLKKELSVLLKAKAPIFEQSLRNELKKKNKVASGRIINSIESFVTIEKDKNGVEEVSLRVIADGDIYYIIGGRKKQGIPPVEKIQGWAKDKGLPFASDKRASFAVAKNLSIKGKKGLNIRSWFTKADYQLYEQVQNLISDVSSDNIMNIIKEEAVKAGLKVD